LVFRALVDHRHHPRTEFVLVILGLNWVAIDSSMSWPSPFPSA
jgi:hypothetical protein